ncbi:hypothetical protein HPB52_007269 [Rhipicephalus sanguineus]|uniref:Tick transposon n=1 Tax=Rhipicephalus sanguineus TaxID=34632 RepID=A0A9D4Q540_RHISA|nr:hypothetical protein HPB52_007269 [Rhipicephalus sanguineus]
MEVAVEGHTITAEEFQADHWTPVLYKAYASRPASSPKPLPYPNATFEAANPNARNAAHDAAAATGSGTTPARLPPATKETRITVKRSKQLPPLPPNAIRVVVRPRVQAELQITLPDDFCLRIHPTNNTFTAATTHSSTAEILKTLTSLTIGDHTYPCVAYVAAPPGATRGVISNAFDDETPTQLYQDLVRRNPEYTILAARRMGKTHSILITFDANEVPHSIKYMGAIHRCTPYRGNSLVIVMTSAQTPSLIFAHVAAHNTCPKNLLARPSAFCARALTLPALDHAKDETFTNHANRQSNQKRSNKNRSYTGTTFPSCRQGPFSPPAQPQKQAWTGPLNKDWGPSRSSSKHASFLTATPTLQDALAKSREEAAAAKAEAQAARAEAAALREQHREARGPDKYTCHKLSKIHLPPLQLHHNLLPPIHPQPYHSQPHLTPSKRKKPKAAEGQDSPIPAVAHDSHPGAAACLLSTLMMATPNHNLTLWQWNCRGFGQKRAVLTPSPTRLYFHYTHIPYTLSAILQNLVTLGVGAKTYNYVRDFLSHRTATLTFGDHSLPGITLAHELAQIPNIHFSFYADDITVWANHGSDAEIEENYNWH